MFCVLQVLLKERTFANSSVVLSVVNLVEMNTLVWFLAYILLLVTISSAYGMYKCFFFIVVAVFVVVFILTKLLKLLYKYLLNHVFIALFESHFNTLN